MNTKDAFMLVYNTLEQHWDETKIDALGLVLSDWDPNVWEPVKGEFFTTGDPALADDWTAAWNRIVGDGKNGTSTQVFAVAKTILDYYQLQVKYDLCDSEEFLKKELGA